jgi:hypothetical protein
MVRKYKLLIIFVIFCPPENIPVCQKSSALSKTYRVPQKFHMGSSTFEAVFELPIINAERPRISKWNGVWTTQ